MNTPKDTMDKEQIEYKFKDLERRLALLEKFIYATQSNVPIHLPKEEEYENHIH